jgi:tellurium resistance protein TerD
MAIHISKGGRINLTKEAPHLQKIGVGLGWDINANNIHFDLDVSIFMLTQNGKLLADEYFVFYNNLKSPDGAVFHQGDNRTGAGDGDDETILVYLDLINPSINEILFVTTIHEADIRKQNFGMIRNAYIRIYDLVDNREVVKYDLDEDFSYEHTLEVARLYRRDGEWRFNALGEGSKIGLQGLVDRYA